MHNRFFLKLLIVVVIQVPMTIGSFTAAAENRTWTDASGKHKIVAQYVESKDGAVTLRKDDGTPVTLPIAKLSAADRRWVARQVRESRMPAQTTQSDSKSNSSSATTSTDWYRWRGPDGTGVSDETGLMTEWPTDGPPVDWSASGFGGGYSSIVVHDGRLFTMGNRGGKTMMICASVDDGHTLWSSPMDSGGDPTGTPTVDPESGLVFGISNDGLLACFDCKSGKEIWRVDFVGDLGGKMMSQWGYSESPLVDGDVLVCTPGSPRAAMAGLNKRTGRPVWSTPMQNASAGYSSPVISNGGGVKQYVTLVGNGLISVRSDNGQALWHYPRIANSTANVPTPVISGDYVLGSSGYGDGGTALLRLASAGRGAVRFQELFYKSNKEMQNHHGGMVLIGTHVYLGHGHNNGFPMCVDLRTGRAAWGPQRGPGSGSAAITAADGHLYFRYENSVMALIEATPAAYRLKSSFRIKSDNGKSWPHPVISNKKLYLRDQDELHCYDIAR